MTRYLVIFMLMATHAQAVAQSTSDYLSKDNTDEFGDWTKVYNYIDQQIDSSRYEMLRVKFCIHTNKQTGLLIHPAIFEIKYGMSPDDDTSVAYGDLVMTGKRQIWENGKFITSVNETVKSFFTVNKSGETFMDIVALPFPEAETSSIVLSELRKKSTNDGQFDFSRTRNLIFPKEQKKGNIRIKHHAPGSGSRG